MNSGGGDGMTGGPINLRYGNVVERIEDLFLPGPINWSQQRSYNSALVGVTALGNRWTSANNDFFIQQNGQDVEFVHSANSKIVFTPVSSGSSNYTPPAGSRLKLTHVGEYFELFNVDTNAITIFHDFDPPTGSELVKGKIREFTTVELRNAGASGLIFYYNDDGDALVDQLVTAGAQAFQIEFYYTLTGKLWLISVSNGGTIQQVEYTYFEDVTSPVASSDVGVAGDLVQVKKSRKDSQGQWISRYTQYRYASDSKMKAVYEHDDVQRAMTQHSYTDPKDLLRKADSYNGGSGATMEQNATKWFTYYGSTDTALTNIATIWQPSGENLERYVVASGTDAERNEAGFVRTERIGGSGCSSCGGGGSVTYEYFYMHNPVGVASTDDNRVLWVIVEDAKDSAGNPLHRRFWATNPRGNNLRKMFTDNPNLSSPRYWCQSWKLADWSSSPNKRGRVIEYRPPSAHKVSAIGDVRNFFSPYDPGSSSWSNDTATLKTASEGAGPTTISDFDSRGRETASRVKRGVDSTNLYYVYSREYGDGTTNPTDFVISYHSYPAKDTSLTASSRNTWTYSYTYWDNSITNPVKTSTTIQPAIPTSQNGSGVASTITAYADRSGRVRWAVDGEGYITYYGYHVITGELGYIVQDADPSSLPSSASDSKWTSPTATDVSSNKPTRSSSLPTAMNLVMSQDYDSLGRRTLATGAIGDRRTTVYEVSRAIEFPMLDSSGNPQLPIEIRKRNDIGQTTEIIQVRANYTAISKTGTVPTGFSTEPTTSDYVGWTKYLYNSEGRLSEVRRYHDIANGLYYYTLFQYDARGRLTTTAQQVSGTTVANSLEQVNVTYYDALGRPKSAFRGTSSAAHDISASLPSTIITVSETWYDGADVTYLLKVGDGHLTRSRTYHTINGSGLPTDYTDIVYQRDFRGRVRGVEKFYNGSSSGNSVGPYAVIDIDWLGRATATSMYTSVPNWSTITGGDGDTAYADATATGRRALSRSKYDPLGQTYQTEQVAVSVSSGAAGDAFRTNTYYDRNGRVVASGDPYGASQELAYDGIGRQYQSRTVLTLPTASTNGQYESSGAFKYNAPLPKPALANLTGGNENVLTFSQTIFDAAGNAIEEHSFEANHDDTNGLNLSGSDFVRRTSFMWYDGAQRLATMADYGSGNESSSTPDTWQYQSVPTRGTAPTLSDAKKLVTKIAYDAKTGQQESLTDPKGIVSMSLYDALGRRTFGVENYINFTPPTTGIGAATADDDRVTKFVYNGLGQLTELVAYNGPSVAQSTKYLFEDTFNASLVTNTIYPDSSDTTSSGTDQVKTAYNLDGSAKTLTDQRGVVLTNTYDSSRRLTRQGATTISSANGSIKAIVRSYDSLGRLEKLTSTANADGSGTVQNEIVWEYDDFGAVAKTWQSHQGAAVTTGGSQSPFISYAYDLSATSGVLTDGRRMYATTYPLSGSATLTDAFGTDDSIGDRLSRPVSRTLGGGSVRSGETHELTYEYTGGGRLVNQASTQTGVSSTMYSGSGVYDAFDRFGRIKRQEWRKSGSAIDRFDYSYDYAGNRLTRDVVGATGFDQLYEYDNLHRLKNMKQGTRSGSSITSKQREQDWGLDPLGNWPTYKDDTDGSGSWDLNQTRAHNAANEVGQITGGFATSPSHDAAGNMTEFPLPKNPTYQGLLATYDAWNRLVAVTDENDFTQTNEYDGLGRRILKSVSDDAGAGRDYYFSDEWQRIVDVDENGVATIYAWHLDYADSLAVRMRNSDEHFFTHDALYSVTSSVSDATDAVVERYHYSPYGETQVLSTTFGMLTASSIDQEHFYTGREQDDETGLQLNRLRWYHCALGKWTNRDPIQYADSASLTLYALGMATVALDPSGAGIEPILPEVGPPDKNCVSKEWKFSLSELISGAAPNGVSSNIRLAIDRLISYANLIEAKVKIDVCTADCGCGGGGVSYTYQGEGAVAIPGLPSFVKGFVQAGGTETHCPQDISGSWFVCGGVKATFQFNVIIVNGDASGVVKGCYDSKKGAYVVGQARVTIYSGWIWHTKYTSVWQGCLAGDCSGAVPID